MVLGYFSYLLPSKTLEKKTSLFLDGLKTLIKNNLTNKILYIQINIERHIFIFLELRSLRFLSLKSLFKKNIIIFYVYIYMYIILL